MTTRMMGMVLLGLLWMAAGIAPVHAGTKHYYYTDAQGTVLAKADAQGNIVASYDYAPYGTQVLGTPPSGPAGYTGHVNDAESGFVYMQARYYDPVVGRFVSIDPVTVAESPFEAFNRYWYANNNPIRSTDPFGRQACDEVCRYEKDFGKKSALAKGAKAIADGASTTGDVVEATYEAMVPIPMVKVGTLGRIGRFIKGLVGGSKAAKGTIRFAQRGVSSTFRHGEFAGRTIDDVAAGLRSGVVNPNQLPIQTITRDGVTYTLNNRSLMTFRRAEMEPTVIKNVTGDPFFEGQLTQRLDEMGGQVGSDFVPIIRGGN